MNGQTKMLLTLGVVSIVALMIASSIFSVVNAESKDALRAIVIAAVLVSAVVYGVALLRKAVDVKDKDAMLRIGSILAIYAVILMAFVYFDYKVGGNINMDKFDSRLRFIIVNAIWIPATFTALVFFYFYKKARDLYKKNVPVGLTILEYVVGCSSFVGSAWGTFDAVYLMTNGDWILSGVMSVSIDAMLFIMGSWHLAANDEVTANVTLFGKFGYFVIALAAQVIDGALRTAGVQTGDYSQFGWTALPFVIIGSGIFIGVTYLIDKWNGGLSFGKKEFPSSGFAGRPNDGQRQPIVIDSGRREQMGYQTRPMMNEGQNPSRDGYSANRPQIPAPQKGQGQKHGQGQSKFAEPGGLTEESVAELKKLGYSNRAIAGMRQTEADNRVKNRVPPRPDQMSGNHPDFNKSQNKSSGNNPNSRSNERGGNSPSQTTPLSEEQLRSELTRAVHQGQFSSNGNGHSEDDAPNPS